MTSFIPISLGGNTLGQRHRHLNLLVNDAYQQTLPFDSIQDIPEQSAVDRLFKIDLASKYKLVDYLIISLKHQDMLFVSRVLKSKWILNAEYCHIINPQYLEDTLYPEMTWTAVNIMKNWITLHLSDHKRCEQFYDFYINNKNFGMALKFLRNCTEEFILNKTLSVLEKITPNHLKIFCEKCPKVAKVFYDNLESTEDILNNYLLNSKEYFDSIKCLLKLDADLYLDITEKRFVSNTFSKLSSEATKFIMNQHKDRFVSKPELYTAWLLDMNTLAKCLNEAEIKDVVLKLARAEYLNYWFTYKNVEPLMKCLSVVERAAFKKQIFVDKNIGDKVEKWPYEVPSSPSVSSAATHIFVDQEHDPDEYLYIDDRMQCEMGYCKRSVMKKSSRWKYACDIVSVRESSLALLFEKYRFAGFEKTFFELRKKMLVENVQNRQDMLLVLVSKAGARQDSVAKLLELLTTRHENEPMHVRATIVRSLVKRSFVWRLPQSSWDLLLRFGRDLGLDGAPSTADCKEGIHAVVLRNMLQDCESVSPVIKAFLNNFSTLKDYSLTAAERRVIASKLPALLLSNVEVDSDKAIERLEALMDTLDAYRVRVDKCSGAIKAIAAAARQSSDAQPLLHRLYRSKNSRRELIRENFEIIQTDESYYNALKHDVDLLSSGEKFRALIESGVLNHDRFLRSLALYFGEKDGLAEKYLEILEGYAKEAPKRELGRALALLSGVKLLPMLQNFHSSPKDSACRRLSSALKANAHLSRPLLDLEAVEWKLLGAKAVANRVLYCSASHIDRNIEALLSWRRTARIALVLSLRSGNPYSTYAKVSEKRPKLAVSTALLHMKNQDKIAVNIWDLIIPLIAKLDLSGDANKKLRKAVNKVSVVPIGVRAKYCATVFDGLIKISRNKAMPMLCNLELILPDVDEDFIEKVIRDFFAKEFTLEQMKSDNNSFVTCACLYLRIIVKYLLISKSEVQQQRRIKLVEETFFKRMDELSSQLEVKYLLSYIDNFMRHLKYSKVFLNTEYVSCFPVFERIIKWMQGFLPIDQHFKIYVTMHLTMLYYKSVRQSLKNNPAIFGDLPKNLVQATEIVGTVFGKYIAREITELTAKYFDSIREMYKVDLLDYLRDYFEYEDRSVFVNCMMKGILGSNESKSHSVVTHIYSWRSDSEEVYNMLKECKNKEVQFFLSNVME